jgi:hypothetical protein
MRGTANLLVPLTVGLLAIATSRVAAVEAVDEHAGDLRMSIVVRTSPQAPNYLDGLLIWQTVLDLQQRSPTFRDLLDVLMASPRSLALLKPAPELLQTQGLIGRTRFTAGPSHVVAFVDVVVERLNPSMRRLAIAHELAHVAEVACLGYIDTQDALHQRMVAHVGSAARRGGPPIETGFALETGQVIVHEVEARVSRPSQFSRLARAHRLTSCPVRPMSDTPQIVDFGESGSEGGGGGVC